MAVNYLDIFLALMLGWMAWKGYKLGFFKSLIAFAGFVMATMLGLESLEILVPMFAQSETLSPKSVMLGSFLVVFGGALFLYKYIENWLYNKAKLQLPSAWDKLIGLVFGGMKGSVVGVLLTMLLKMMPISGAVAGQLGSSVLASGVSMAGTSAYNLAVKLIPGTMTFVGNLEKTAELVGPDRFDAETLGAMQFIGSTKVDGWKDETSANR